MPNSVTDKAFMLLMYILIFMALVCLGMAIYSQLTEKDSECVGYGTAFRFTAGARV